ncbi:prephenate dehydrogenase [Paraburkholderia panacisoli]|uniref:Prephenate dehydrogenase n=1 Tax=Paraburkholderia panacisoli TaxID=2603818 RepID=A0A5B0H1P4_9BURK|nr:prephenate dehydrogenase [Paraburkholderia panacisoli]
MWFWNDSKVSGTKRCNKTTGAYSGIPGDDMRAGRLKGDLKARARAIGAQPFAAAMCGRSPRLPGARGYM